MKGSCDILKRIDIFSELSDDEFSELYGLMSARDLKEGEVLFCEGDDGDEMFVIVSGSVAVDVSLHDGKKIVIAEIREGDFIGEMSIVEELPRSASCTARGKTSLLSLSAKALRRLMEERSSMAVKILHRMALIAAGRLDSTGQFVSEMVQWGGGLPVNVPLPMRLQGSLTAVILMTHWTLFSDGQKWNTAV
jgi:CRP-like cAMP-binding protein